MPDQESLLNPIPGERSAHQCHARRLRRGGKNKVLKGFDLEGSETSEACKGFSDKIIVYICAMTTLTIEIPEKAKKTLADFVEQLGGKVVSGEVKPKKSSKKADGLSAEEKEFLKGFDEAIEFVNQHREGKVKAKTIDQLLNEL